MQQKHVRINPIFVRKSEREINSTKCRKWVTLLALFTIGFHLNSFAQKLQLEWANRMGGYGTTASGGYADEYHAVISDELGYVYVAGNFFDTVVFATKPNATVLISEQSNKSACIAKYDPQGNCIWAIKIGAKVDNIRSYSNIESADLTLDNKGHLFVTGAFRDTIDFDRSMGINTLTSHGSDDAYIAMFDTSGRYLWAKRIGSDKKSKPSSGRGLSTDLSGNVYIAGGFTDTVSFVGSGSTIQLIPKGGMDGFVAKYNNKGDCVWARRIGSVKADEKSTGVSVDAAGNAFVCGDFADTADFGIGSATLTSNGSNDGYIVKYDSTGNYLWAINFGGNSYEATTGIAVDASGDAFVTGYFMGVASFNPQNTALLTGVGYLNAFVAKYDAYGNYKWAIKIDASVMGISSDIALDKKGNVYTTGTYVGTADFDAKNPGKFVRTSAGADDIYLARYDGNNGGCLWAENLGGLYTDMGLGVDVDNAGNVFFCGGYKNYPIDFDPGPDTVTLELKGGEDGYLIKFACNDTTSSYIKVRECNNNYTLNGEFFSEDGVYTQQFPNAAGCDSTLTLELTFVNMDKPVINVDTLILSTTQGNYQTYQWIKNGIAIPGATQNKYTVSENADYQVAVTGGEGCLDTSEIYTVKNVVSIDDLYHIGKHIQIYPNPSENIIHISSPIKINIHLFSIEGRRIQSFENGSHISLKDLANGVYLIQITNTVGNVLKYEKVIKQ